MRDHPRVCGEKCGPLRWGPEIPGSPPRVRGKGQWMLCRHFLPGITPACAGKSPASGPGCGKTGDHPRVCGEKRSHTDANNDTVGSPPRVRGKGKNAYRPERTTGITPACAGKSPFFPGVPGLRWDHPRVCGEKNIPQIHISRSTGSPPRVRGKVVESWNSCVFSGITPACAGKREL